MASPALVAGLRWGSQAGVRGGRRGRVVRMHASGGCRESGASRLRDLHDGHAMHTRGIRVGYTLLHISRVDMGGGGRVYLVCGRFARGDLGSLDGEILGILINLLDDIALIVSLDGIMGIAPVVFLCGGRRAGSSEVELETVGGEAGGVGGHVPGWPSQSSAGREERKRSSGGTETARMGTAEAQGVVKKREEVVG